MDDEGFASKLWKNVKAVRLGKDGGLEAPVRADGRDGIRVGLDAVAETETRRAEADRGRRETPGDEPGRRTG